MTNDVQQCVGILNYASHEQPNDGNCCPPAFCINSVTMSLCLRPPLLAFIQFVHLFVATASFQLVLPIANTKWPQPSTTIRRQTKESDESSSSIFADDADNKSTNNLIETCPFSKSFGRYQVDLTSSSKFQKKEEGGFRLFPFQKSISETVSRSKLQQQLSSNKEEFIWIQDLDGVAAFAFLWERAAYLLHEDKAISTSEVIALPDASPSVVQNWIEIVEWMNGQLELIPSGASTILASSMMENQSVPAVRIQRVGSTGSASNEISSARPTKFSSEQVISGTRSWVRRILVDEGICPFTKSDRKSGQGLSDVGVPVGGILYSTSFAKNAIQLQADTWNTILEMIEAGPGGKSGISSILLAAPSFDEDFDIWAGPIFAMLEAGVVAAQALQQVGVVCFHPLYATPDGTSWVSL